MGSEKELPNRTLGQRKKQEKGTQKLRLLLCLRHRVPRTAQHPSASTLPASCYLCCSIRQLRPEQKWRLFLQATNLPTHFPIQFCKNLDLSNFIEFCWKLLPVTSQMRNTLLKYRRPAIFWDFPQVRQRCPQKFLKLTDLGDRFC